MGSRAPQVPRGEPDRVYRLRPGHPAQSLIGQRPAAMTIDDLAPVPADVPRQPGVTVRIEGKRAYPGADRVPSHCSLVPARPPARLPAPGDKPLLGEQQLHRPEPPLVLGTGKALAPRDS